MGGWLGLKAGLDVWESKKFLPVRFLVFFWSVLSSGAIKLNVLCCINAVFNHL